MKKYKKNYEYITISILPIQKRELEEIKEKYDLSISQFIRKLINEYLKNNKNIF